MLILFLFVVVLLDFPASPFPLALLDGTFFLGYGFMGGGWVGGRERVLLFEVDEGLEVVGMFLVVLGEYVLLQLVGVEHIFLFLLDFIFVGLQVFFLGSSNFFLLL